MAFCFHVHYGLRVTAIIDCFELFIEIPQIVTGFWKMVPNHTFLFQYIYHCNMKSIAFPIIFHSTTRNSILKLLKEYKKYSVNTYT